MPRSRSWSIESITWSTTASWAEKTPDWRSIASTSVVLPWSTWAMMATLRMSVRRGTGTEGRRRCVKIGIANHRSEKEMTGKSDFTEEEWTTVLEGPPSAGLIVITAQRGGTFRETYSMAKAYTEARQDHGASELLDEIVSAKPHVDHTRYSSPEELKQAGLQRVRDAVALLEAKASPE